MKVKIFKKDSTISNVIYLDNKIIGDYKDMLNIIINNPNQKYKFINFDELELKALKAIIKKQTRDQKEIYRKITATITTHKLQEKTKRYYYINAINSYRKPFPFVKIDSVELKRIEQRDIMIVEGLIESYGISNEYGFYDIDEDKFIPYEELENKKNIKLELLDGPDVIHYVKKRVL